jgi:hypothetical protein
MNHALALVLLLVAAAPGWSQALETAARVEWAGQPPSSGPLRVGPLSAGGLLKELFSPLGFSAWSDVFADRTGFTVDRSLSKPDGFALVSGALGCFFQPAAGGSVQLGTFLSLQPAAAWRLDGALCVSEPPAGAEGDSWYPDHPMWPGGRLVNAGARLRAAFAGAAACATVGFSLAKFAPAGGFAELQASLEPAPVGAWVLVGASTADYRTPSGDAAETAFRASARLGIQKPFLSADLRWTVDVARPGFAPRPYIPQHEEIRIAFERAVPTDAPEAPTLRLEAAKRVNVDETGAVSEDARCGCSVRACFPRGSVSAGVSWSADSGAKAEVSVTLVPAGFFGLEVKAQTLDRGQTLHLAVLATLREAEGFPCAPDP